MGTGAPARVEALPAQPPRISFLGSALDVSPTDLLWGNGFRWTPEACVTGDLFDPCAGGTKAVSLDDNESEQEADSFIVWAGVSCSTFDPEYAGRELQARALRALLACESRHVAREFWDGTLAQAAGWPNFYLRQPGFVAVTGNGGEAPVSALACLEAGLDSCKCGDGGVIHMTKQVATYLFNAQVLERVDGQTRTKAGETKVIIDAGYTGTAPTGIADATDVAWMYATDAVAYRKQKDPRVFAANVKEAVDRDTNTATWLAERAFGVQVDPCCHLAAAVQIVGCANLTYGS